MSEKRAVKYPGSDESAKLRQRGIVIRSMNEDRLTTIAAAETGMQDFIRRFAITGTLSVEVSPADVSIILLQTFFLTSKQTSAHSSLTVTARTAPAAA